MKRLLKLILIVAVVLAVRTAAALAVAAWHYSSTPTMEEWARERPVPDSVWDSAPATVIETERRSLWAGDSPATFERYAAWEANFRFEHGDDLLLGLELEFRIEAEEVEDWLERGVQSEAYGEVAVHAKRADLHPDFHAVVVYSMRERSESDSSAPWITADVFVLAGPGEVELIGRVGPKHDYGLGGGDLGVQAIGEVLLKGFILGVLHPMGGPPEEGIGYHASASLIPSWTRVDGGSAGAGFGSMGATTTTRQYSIQVETESKGKAPYGPASSSSMTSHVELNYTWSGETW